MATILVVDDRPTNREFLVTLLRYSGHRLLEAADGPEALALVRAERPNLAIVDILMPTMDGYQFVQQLRADPAIASMPVIFYTATYREQEAQSLAQACGVSHVLSKPCDPEVILRIVSEVLSSAPPPTGGTLAPEDFHREHERVLVEKVFQKVTELEAANARLIGLLNLSQQLAKERDDGIMLHKFCHTAHDLLEAEYAATAVFDGDGKSFRHFFTSGLDAQTVTRIGLPGLDWGILATSLAERGSLRLRDVNNQREALGFPPHHPRVQSLVRVPIASATKSYGLVYFCNKLGAEEFNEEDEHLALTLATQLAVAYENLQQYEQSQRHASRLEQEIAERKRLEEQYLQVQKMEAIGRLAGGVAHDFNNLLTIINGYSEILLGQRVPPDSARALIEEIQKAGNRAIGLTRQLLAFSRQEVVAPKVLDLNVVVSDTEKMLRRLIGEDMKLTSTLDPALGWVKADPGQIEQVLMNLAVNARDAMPQGGRLSINTVDAELDEKYAHEHPELKPGRYALVAVSDTGSGMDEATKARIFEPFFTTKGPGKGTGLGLATVYGIVKQWGGYIYVSSELGQGTTFKIYFPVVVESLSPGASKVGPATAAVGTETLLLVEDEDGVRMLTRHVLEMYGYTVLEASNGTQAIPICEQHAGPIHLVVSDIVMPEMGGRRLAERLEASRPGIKVLYLSGYTDDAVIRHGVLEAETAFLQKPFTPVALAWKVREVLDEYRPSQQVRSAKTKRDETLRLSSR